MATLEYAVPGVTCPACTGAIYEKIAHARKNNQLNPAIRAINIDLADEPPRAFVEVDASMKKPTCLHFLPSLPTGKELNKLDLTLYKDSYVYLDSQLYYVSQSGSIETVRLKDKNCLALKQRDACSEEKEPRLPLSLEEENQLITRNGGFARLSRQAVQTEIGFLTEEVGFSFTPAEAAKTQMYKHFFQGVLGLLLGSVFMGLCLSGLPLSMTVFGILGAFSTLFTLYLGKDVYKEAFKKLKAKQFTMHTLFSISSLMALGVSFASFFAPWLPMMFDTALLVLGFFHIGKAYEKSTKLKLRQAVSYRSLAPAKILARRPGESNFTEKLIHDIQPQDIIRVPQGQVIGLNGIYVPEAPDEKKGGKEEKYQAPEQNAFIKDPYSGSHLPQAIRRGNAILAGCIVPDSQDFIQLQVTACEEDSYLALLERQSKKSQAEKAPLEAFAAKLLHYFVPAVLMLAAVSAVIIGICLTPLTAIQVTATLLASICPCTLGLIIPLTVKIAFAKAVTESVEFANSQVLQTADEVKTVVFDLNGTLTTGQVRVSAGHPSKPASNLPPHLLCYLAAIEKQSGSTHAFAKALQQYVYQDLKWPENFDPQTVKIEKSSHCGIVATIGGKTYRIGSKDFMRKPYYKQDLLLKRGFEEEEIQAAEIQGHQAEHVVYLAEDEVIQGCVLLTDPLRKEAKEVVSRLRQAGKDVCICTGASYETAAKYARLLEIPVDEAHIAAGCAPATAEDAKHEDAPPQSKTAFIQRTKKRTGEKKVAMIGDGLNDTLAFEKSDFSIAIESPRSHEVPEKIRAVIESKAAAVIRHKRDTLSLRSILFAFSISKQTAQVIKRSLALSLSYNVLVAFAIGGLLVGLGLVINPAIGAALMFIQSGLILASLRCFKNQKLTYANDPLLPEELENREKSTTQQLQHSLQLPRVPVQFRDDLEIPGSALAQATLQRRQGSHPSCAPRVPKGDLELGCHCSKNPRTWTAAPCCVSEIKPPHPEFKTSQGTPHLPPSSPGIR